jgi:hypothetical protein
LLFICISLSEAPDPIEAWTLVVKVNFEYTRLSSHFSDTAHCGVDLSSRLIEPVYRL